MRQRCGMVYFAREMPDGPIKIGFATNVERRLNNLQIGNPREIKVVAAFPGTLATEDRVHRLFFNDHLRGEWFQPSPGLLQFIETECVAYDRKSSLSYDDELLAKAVISLLSGVFTSKSRTP